MNKWISVDERLPDKAGDYLVAWTWARETKWEKHNVDIVYFRGKSHWAKLEDKITHWMEKPKHPKDKEDDEDED